MNEQLILDILLNPSVAEIGEKRLSRQARDIWSLFKYKQLAHRLRLGLKVTTGDLASIALQYNARVNEIRHALVKTGGMIDEVEGEGGVNYYQIVPLEKSTFWAKVKKKNEQWKWL